MVFCVKGVFSLTNVALESGSSAVEFGGAENGLGWRPLLLVPAVLDRDKNWDKGCSRGPKTGTKAGVCTLLSLSPQTDTGS